ncbi:DUF1801 domain-containing protein [Sabulilitoribacter multivorans]|uniref:DUF1801 domain-containing protein n=1 Tax=Flaviramulus multivorans TaxID=1304750 RepID=A0ABS9IK21_9FLAO|nr:DUF1801 domain-containing protein [Flaviramulus multivorans]MCF7560930.1 DUF1801 domain-containing protein [Flaviramulus multivorans]
MRHNKDILTIDDYMQAQPDAFKPTLQNLREVIQEAAPKANEAIRYAIPTFRLGNKNLVHFAAHKAHFALYPAPSAIVKFSKELSKYDTSKGTIKFPIETPIPYDLITKIVEFRVSEINSKP